MKKRFGLFFPPVVLFLLVFVHDAWRLAGSRFALFPPLVREGFLAVGLVALLFGVAVGRRGKSFHLIGPLKAWFGLTVGLWVVMQLVKRTVPFFEFSETFMRFYRLVSLTVLFWITASIGVRLLFIVKELVFVQQRKTTHRNFLLLFVCMAADTTVVFLQGSEHGGGLRFWPAGSAVEHVSFAGVMLFAAVNGRRTAWIHYLNKKQKTRTLFGGMVAAALIVFTMIVLPGLLRGYSPVAGAFAASMTAVNLVCSGFALVAILAHLPSAGLMDKRMKEIQSLQGLSAAMNSVFDREKLLPTIVDLCLPVVDADAVWLELKSGKTFMGAASKGFGADGPARMPADLQLALREAVLAQDGPLLINDLPRDKRTSGIRDWPRKAGSLLASRLHFQGHPIGILYALKEEPFGFAEESGSMFQAFADQAAISLENTRLVRLSIEQERYREELRLAHDAQMRLLPQAMPDVPGMELHGFCLTANDIGGDFYNAFSPGPDRLDILVGDVSGNGATAAFTMAELHGSLQVLAYRFQSPKDILLEINGQTIESPEGLVEQVGTLKPRQRVTFLALDHRTGNTGNVQVVVR